MAAITQAQRVVATHAASGLLELRRAMSGLNSVANWGAIFSMSSLSLVPVVTIVTVFQRHRAQRITTTGSKGQA
jgi:ABC-type glycerol-3-phosphate transport system permease component